jgi:hypothetical protein
MNTVTKTKAAVIGTVLAGSAALVLASPSSPALAYFSGGLHLDAVALSPATLVSRGAAVDVPVDVYCNAQYVSLSIRLSERVGSQTATGSTYLQPACTGGHQRILVRVPASSGKAFAKGTAVATVEIYGCNYYTCGQETSSETITITK